MKTRLRQQRVVEAYDLGKAGLAMSAYTTELLAEMGDVEFRQGEMMEAEQYYLHALRVNEREMRAYLGLARLYDAYSMHRVAYNRLKDAHTLTPQDPDVQRAWFRMLSRRERLHSIEEYLSSPHPDDQDYTNYLRQYAEFLRVTADKPVHACRLVSSVKETQTPLIILRPDPKHVSGLGMSIKLNQHSVHVQLDTGASGILIGRNAAESAGLERIANLSYGGSGSGGLQGGYTAVAKHIRIGELEFEDCVVHASDHPSIVEGEDGIIGANVFASYLIDIDGPALKLKLSPPSEKARRRNCRHGVEHYRAGRGRGKYKGAGHEKNGNATPKDRYVAPEMKDWSTVFRLGEYLLIPTQVRLPEHAVSDRHRSKYQHDLPRLQAKSPSYPRMNEGWEEVCGATAIYTADKVKLHFSHFTQQYYNLTSLDLSNSSRSCGTEVSGLLGIDSLGMMELKIDYRDGLVDFSYDPKRVRGFAH